MSEPQKSTVTLDVECYVNYFLIKFKSVDTGKVREYELFPGGEPLNYGQIRHILESYLIVTFNGNGYDLPMVVLAMTGVDCETLKQASDQIILGEMKAWEFYRAYNLSEPTYCDHIDLIEVAFGQGSLKLYGGRLHSRKLQDLPLPPDARISAQQRPVLRDYCGNDHDTTADLFRHLKGPLDLRAQMSEMYGVDLRSKSDAQIAEAVIRKEIEDRLGYRVSKPSIPPGTRFRYKAPAFIRFQTEQLQLRLAEIQDSSFVIDVNGSPIEPKALAGMTVKIANGVYRMGIGGLHSSETNAAHHAGNGIVLMDADVTSYYPSIILGCDLFPEHLTHEFLNVYRSIFERRVAAKKAGNKVVNEVLKIVLNGSYGKFGSKYSVLYSPHLMIQVTVTGQLALLMLIEALHLDGIECVSANTDGIVLKFHESRMDDVRAHIAEWSERTGFGMEETFYKALFSRDVNNYLALKDKGVKGKGEYAEPSISKNPDRAIVNEAVKLFLEHGTPIEKTIRECQDVRKFLVVQRVTGGAVKVLRTNYDDTLKPSQMRALLLANGWLMSVEGPLSKARFVQSDFDLGMDVETAYRTHCGDDEVEYIGKVVRFYIGRGVKSALHTNRKTSKGNRNKVPGSDGAVPCMELPDSLPDDIDYDHYIDYARRVLRDIGAC